ncbi:SAR2788 family putative toxin [Staphylococcus arlettae]|uniref:SAR2788 family putative toxin n=1 Tax=Staphylococcus arlettae TaxID=29378 RepID=UPI00186B8882|nr:SAR2788 family putative toxin [Staphylococcus arlettae]QZZ03623.1 SAR2788 family putative toxin [Staphylococcus arlettae]
MKVKIICFILSISVLVTYGGIAEAVEVIKEADIERNRIDFNKIDEKINTQNNITNIENNYDTKDLEVNSKITYNSITGETTAKAKLNDSYNNNINKSYNINFIDIIDENNFIAEFIDIDTGEKIIYNSNELRGAIAPIIPIIIGILAKQGLKTAIKKYGKSAVTNAIKSNPKAAFNAANRLGYSPTNYISQGKRVFKKNGKGHPKYITVDRTNHNGGAWKGASSVRKLGAKKTRSGTYDVNLKRIGD